MSGAVTDGTVAVSVPAITLSASLSSSTLCTVAGIIPAPRLSAVMDNPAIITAALTVPRVSLASALIPGNIYTAALLIKPPTLSMAGASGGLITVAVSAPVPTLSAAGYPASTITVAVTLPKVQLAAFMSAPVSVAFRTWVLNIRKGALSEYGSEFAFNSFATYRGQVLACGASGVVVLGTQATDSGTAITARFRTGKSNYGSSFHKRVPRIYADLATDGDLIFRSITNEGGVRSYLLPNNNVVGIQSRRVPVGKGPRSTYFQYEVENVNGADLTVPALLVYPVKLRRRVS